MCSTEHGRLIESISQETPSHPVDPSRNEGLRIRVARFRLMAKLIKAKDEDAARSKDSPRSEDES